MTEIIGEYCYDRQRTIKTW